MINWIKPASLIEYRQEEPMNVNHPDFRMERVDDLPDPTSMTALGQFYAAACLGHSDSVVIDLPVPDSETEQLILNEIASHFADVRRISVENEGNSIRMMQLKPGSRLLCEAAVMGAMPIFKDLYRHSSTVSLYQGKRRTLLLFSIETSRLEPYVDEDLNPLNHLLCKAYLNSGKEYNVTPRGWILNEDLCESIALRFFAGFSPSITLYVDEDTNEVVMLRLAREPHLHTVLIREEEPGQTRVMDSFLYLYISGGTVYVIQMQSQSPIRQWEDLNACTLYQLEPGERFADFDHSSAEPMREGMFLLFDQDTRDQMVEAVNKRLRISTI